MQPPKLISNSKLPMIGGCREHTKKCLHQLAASWLQGRGSMMLPDDPLWLKCCSFLFIPFISVCGSFAAGAHVFCQNSALLCRLIRLSFSRIYVALAGLLVTFESRSNGSHLANSSEASLRLLCCRRSCGSITF